MFVATEEGRFATHSNLTITETSFETRRCRKTRLATSRLMLGAIKTTYPNRVLGAKVLYQDESFFKKCETDSTQNRLKAIQLLRSLTRTNQTEANITLLQTIKR